jgi:hypothetical protein
MKYKIKGTDILYNGKVYAEGKTIELNEKDASAILDYLDLIPEEASRSRAVSKPTQTPKSNTTKTGATDAAKTSQEGE